MQSNSNFKIIAETAFTHEGNFSYLIEQTNNAILGQADFIKFQILIDPENFFSDNKSLEKFKKYILSPKEWGKIIEYAYDNGIKVIVLPLTVKSLTFVLNNYFTLVDGFELHSVNFMEISLVEILAQIDSKKIFLGVSGRYLEEIKFVYSQLKSPEIILMYGFQSFPTDKYTLNLSKIRTLAKMFPKSFIGYADHSEFDKEDFLSLSEYAYLLGSRFFELHIINKLGDNRLDFYSAHEFDDFLRLRERLNNLINILGNDEIDKFNEKEIKYRERKKMIVTSKKLLKGHLISKDDVIFKVLENKESEVIDDYDEILGKVLLKDKTYNEPFFKGDLNG